RAVRRTRLNRRDRRREGLPSKHLVRLALVLRACGEQIPRAGSCFAGRSGTPGRHSCIGSRARSEAARMNAAAQNAHLLVVDDDMRLRALLQRYLTSNGYRVTAAGNAGEARALMKSIAFDLLIVDVMMPGESGLDLTQSIRAQSQTPVLMLTARGEAEDRIAGFEKGA